MAQLATSSVSNKDVYDSNPPPPLSNYKKKITIIIFELITIFLNLGLGLGYCCLSP